MGTYTLNTAGLIALLLQFALPVGIGLVTKASMPAGVKAVLLLFSSAVVQFVVAWLDSVTNTNAFNWQAVAWSVMVGFVISVASHFGLWKPTGISAAATNSLVKD